MSQGAFGDVIDEPEPSRAERYDLVSLGLRRANSENGDTPLSPLESGCKIGDYLTASWLARGDEVATGTVPTGHIRAVMRLRIAIDQHVQAVKF